MTVNALGQPVGDAIPDWTPRPHPAREVMAGRYCRLEPLEPRHAASLWRAFAADAEGRNWTYLAHGPYASFDAFAAWVATAAATADPLFFAICSPEAGACGVAAYLRIAPDAGAIEVGHIHLSPALQRTPAATEAMFLMMSHAFALGYRRYEWKCDSLNEPSRSAAARLGFVFEGIFRQALVYKGRNRDTAWYAIVDGDWPAVRAAFEQWLAPANFDAGGGQRTRLAELMPKR